MKKTNHIQKQRFFKVIKENKIWSTDSLLKKINLLLPSNLEINVKQLFHIIAKQITYRVFRCRYNNRMHYIFKKRC